MCREHNKTIIITTHYIEEANLANNVSLYNMICVNKQKFILYA